MITSSHRRKLAAIGAGAALALPAAAQADGPMVKDYSLNSATGDAAPPVKSTAPSPVAEPTEPGGDGFAWGEAGAGAGLALLLTGGALGGRVVVRRRRTLARPSP